MLGECLIWMVVSLSKPTCSYKNKYYVLIFGTQQGLLGRPLRPQNPHDSNGEVMANGKRTIVKRLRFTDAQVQKLEGLLEAENMIFTDFIHFLITREFLVKNNFKLVEVENEAENQNEVDVENNEAKKKHRRKAKFMQPYTPKIDPELLRELGRIGNNINQIAKSLNRLCLGKQADIERFSFGMCLHILSEIQQELHQHLEPLPPIVRSDAAVERAKQHAIARATTGRS